MARTAIEGGMMMLNWILRETSALVEPVRGLRISVGASVSVLLDRMGKWEDYEPEALVQIRQLPWMTRAVRGAIQELRGWNLPAGASSHEDGASSVLEVLRSDLMPESIGETLVILATQIIRDGLYHGADFPGVNSTSSDS